MSPRLFHIVDRDVWAAAAAIGEYRPASLAAEGFVHLSFAGQVAATAERFYRGVPNLCVVEIDAATVPAPLRMEDSYGSGTQFPHLYGPIPTTAAVAVHEFGTGPDGARTFSTDG